MLQSIQNLSLPATIIINGVEMPAKHISFEDIKAAYTLDWDQYLAGKATFVQKAENIDGFGFGNEGYVSYRFTDTSCVRKSWSGGILRSVVIAPYAAPQEVYPF